MGRLKCGDRVVIHFQAGEVVSAREKQYDQDYTLEIVGRDNHGYYLYIPQYISLAGTITVDARNRKHIGVSELYLDEEILYVMDESVCRVEYILDGMTCDRCEEFIEWATPNQIGGGFLCWSCRSYPYR